MSEERVLRDVFRAKNHWLAIYWCMKETAEWSIGWWDADRFGIRLWRLMIVYRPPPARIPKGSQIMSTNGCMAWTLGVGLGLAMALFGMYLYGVSWQTLVAAAAGPVIFGLCLGITIAILDWRVE
jgi:hypothetical protein